MDYLPSKKILWLVIGVIAVEGLLVFGSKYDGFEKKVVASPNLGAENSPKTTVFFRDQNTSEKMIAEIAPTDNVLNYLNEVGRSLAEGSQSIIIPEAKLTVPEPHYKRTDLTLVATAEVSVREYMASVLTVLKSRATDIEEDNALTIINRWLEEGNEDDLTTITGIKKVEQVRALALSRIPVPETLADTHLELINSMYATGAALADIGSTRTNPQIGLFASATYANFKSKQSQAVIAITQYYNRHLASLASR